MGDPSRLIRLPEPASGSMGGPEIFGGGFYGVIRRAIVIGNGFAGSENQSIGLVRALGLSNHQSLFVSNTAVLALICLCYVFNIYLYSALLFIHFLASFLNLSLCLVAEKLFLDHEELKPPRN